MRFVFWLLILSQLAIAASNGPKVSGTAPIVVTNSNVSIPRATSSVNGYLSSTDWSTFNGKQATLTLGNLTSGTSGVAISGGTGAVIGSGTSLTIQTASTSQIGLLTNADWNTFNNKQSALTFGNLTSSTTGVSVVNGSNAVIGSGTSFTIQTASGSQPGLLASSDWTTFNNKAPTASPVFTGNVAIGTNTSSVSKLYVTSDTGTFTRGINVDTLLTLSATSGSVLRVQPNVAAGSTATNIHTFNAAGATFGSGATATDIVDFFTNNQTAGTNNAAFADNDSFTGNWFINQANTRANLLTGSLNLASTATSLTLTGGGGGAGKQVFSNLAASGHYNWQEGAQINVSNGFEITPSTSTDGSTFSQPAFVITRGSNITYAPDGSSGGASIYANTPSSGKYNFHIANNYAVGNVFEITPSTAVDGFTFSSPIFTANASTSVITLGPSGNTTAAHSINGILQVTGSSLTLNESGGSASSGTVHQNVSTGSLSLYGDAGTTGGGLSLFAASNATSPGAGQFSNSVGVVGQWDGSGRFSFGGGTTTSAQVTVGSFNPTQLAGTNQQGLRVTTAFDTTVATATANAVNVIPTTLATAGTTGVLTGMNIGACSLGSGSAATRVVNLYTNACTGGATGNAFIADNASFSGNYFINSTSTNPSVISGTMTIGSGTTQQHKLNTLLATNGSGTGTFTNLPSGYSGNPSGYIQMTINGVTHVIPYW